MGYDKNSVYFYNSKILEDLKKKGVNINNVHYWSDGPSCQFKNQYNICNLRFHLEDHGMVADWNFFATAHGKGENDGAGGDVKNGVWRKVLQKKAFVSDLNDFVNVAKEKFKTFNIFDYSKDEVRSGEEFLKQHYKNHSKLISGIGEYHYIKIVDAAVIMQYVSPSCVCHPRNKVVEEPALLQIDDIADEPSASPIMDLDIDNNELEEGMYIVVTYQEVNFPGIITQLQSDGGAKVKVMHRCVGGWYWPSHDDEIDYQLTNILERDIPYLIPVNRRGHTSSQLLWTIFSKIERTQQTLCIYTLITLDETLVLFGIVFSGNFQPPLVRKAETTLTNLPS